MADAVGDFDAVMDGLSIRHACEGDSDFVLAVKEAAFREYVDQVWGWDHIRQRKMHDARFASQDVRIIGFQANDIGYFSTSSTTDSVRVHQIFILPEYQGKGFGTACMNRIVADARAQKKTVTLQVLKINTRGIAFYRRLGFTIVGEDDTRVQFETGQT